MELPLTEVSNVVQPAKNEVSVEFTQKENQKKTDSLVEIRFYVPGTVTADGLPKDADDEEQENDKSAAEYLYETLKADADLGASAGEVVVTFPELPCLTPRYADCWS